MKFFFRERKAPEIKEVPKTRRELLLEDLEKNLEGFSYAVKTIMNKKGQEMAFVKIFDETDEYNILQNDITPIFWISSIPDDELSILVYNFFENNDEQGKVHILEFPKFPNIRILAIKIGDNFFAESFEYEQELF